MKKISGKIKISLSISVLLLVLAVFIGVLNPLNKVKAQIFCDDDSDCPPDECNTVDYSETCCSGGQTCTCTYYKGTAWWCAGTPGMCTSAPWASCKKTTTGCSCQGPPCGTCSGTTCPRKCEGGREFWGGICSIVYSCSCIYSDAKFCSDYNTVTTECSGDLVVRISTSYSCHGNSCGPDTPITETLDNCDTDRRVYGPSYSCCSGNRTCTCQDWEDIDGYCSGASCYERSAGSGTDRSGCSCVKNSCGAECSQASHCGTDHCDGDVRYTYSCSNCLCSTNTYDCNDDDYFDPDYCIGDERWHDLNDYACSGAACVFDATVPTFIEDCDVLYGDPNAYCEGGVCYPPDYTPPTTDIECNGGGPGSCDPWFNADVGVTLSCSDNQSGCQTTYYCVDANPCDPTITYTGLFSVTTERINYVSYYSIDNKDNSETKHDQPVRLDKTPPYTVSVTGAPGTWQNFDAQADIYCEDALSDCDPTTYRLEIYSTDPVTCPTNYADYTLASPQTVSSHSWVCGAAMDNATNTGFSSPVEFMVEQTLPSVSVTGAPPTWQNMDATAAVSCTDTGGSACDFTTYRLIIYSTDPGTCSINYDDYTLASPQAISSHSWVCGAAMDNATNTGFSPPVEFMVDKEAPIPQITSPTAGSWQGQPSFDVFVTDLDTGGSGLATCDFVIYDNGAPTASGSRACPNGSFTVNVPGDCGTHGENTCTVHARATDVAGNTGMATITVHIDLNAPTTDILCNGAPCTTDWYYGSVDITLNCSDDDSGCATIYYCVDQTDTCSP
ncbi:hypothetical protein KJA15_00285 [Patescibacteria group bacterium]|nr:hypothetical protein [Patescibacteria group bacterium]